MRTIEKVALAVIEDKKVLMARSGKNEEVFYTLGGKIENNETDEQCLIREIKEEVDADIRMESLVFLGVFEASAYNKPDTKVVVRLYRGDLISTPVASSEVEEIAFFDSSMPEEHRSELAVKVLMFLKGAGHIN